VARKTLLAVAGIVSVHDRTWTTDRELAARRWAAVDPARAAGLTTLLDWSDDRASAGAAGDPHRARHDGHRGRDHVRGADRPLGH
jgi:hypothetical protein